MLVEELRNELEQAKAIDDELKNRDLIIEQYQSTIAGLESQITKLREHQNEHQMLSEQLRNLTEEHISIAKERESNLEKIADLEKINVGLRASLVESEDEKNVLNSKLVKLEDLSVKFQSLDRHLHMVYIDILVLPSITYFSFYQLLSLMPNNLLSYFLPS